MATASEYVESVRFKETPTGDSSEINKQEALKMVRYFNIDLMICLIITVRRF